MDTKIVLAALIGLIIGAGGATLVAKDNDEMPDMGSHMMGNDSVSMNGAIRDMMSGLSGKTGDEFDKAFLSEMILHHEGAVDMAEAALANAKHDEIKQMANAIISAQTAEIKQMKEWMSAWYGE